MTTEAPASTLTIADLEAASPDPASPFGVDEHINVATLDSYLDLEGAVYRDMRMMEDPADYEAIGGSSLMNFTVEGFRNVPFPFIATLPPLPVEGAYDGTTLFTVVWSPEGAIESVTPNFAQSTTIIEELFPQDSPLFLMCGGGGYAGLMRDVLVFLGWDPAKVYNLGGAWGYQGSHAVPLLTPREDGTIERTLWRADIAPIVFEDLDPIA